MQLPSGDDRYSLRMNQIKAGFRDQPLAAGLPEATVTDFQCKRGEYGIWQPRFREHTVCDEHDLERCMDYIHRNPREYGLVERVVDWPWSSFSSICSTGAVRRQLGWCGPEVGGRRCLGRAWLDRSAGASSLRCSIQPAITALLGPACRKRTYSTVTQFGDDQARGPWAGIRLPGRTVLGPDWVTRQ